MDDASADFTAGVGWDSTTCHGESNKQPPVNATCFVHGYDFSHPANEENQGPYYHTWEETAHFGSSGTSTFDLKIPEAGLYTLSAWWPAVSPAPTGALAWNAAVDFEVLDGPGGKVLGKQTFSQTDSPTNGDRWNAIVTNHTLPTTAFVSVTCAGQGLCVADAVLVESVARLNDGSDVGATVTVPGMDGTLLAKTSCSLDGTAVRNSYMTKAGPVRPGAGTKE